MLLMYVAELVILLWLNQAEALRLECKCPALKTRDPRIAVAGLQQLVAEKNIAQEKSAASSRTSSNSTTVVPRDSVSVS